MKRLLLASNSTNFGGGYLDHLMDEISGMLAGTLGRIVFVPFAIGDWDMYVEKVRQRLVPEGYTVDSVHEADDEAGRRKLLREANLIFIGGGNTFRLLAATYQFNLLDEIRQAVAKGACYMGASAGSNVACPTMKTTNDMPIIYPPSFDALGLVPFNINPHYLDPDPNSMHMGETRPMRIAEFHELNDVPVVGLREGAMLVIEDAQITLKGDRGARLFRKEAEPVELEPGAILNPLMYDGTARSKQH